ncbi:hypothetical protein D3C71_1881070 [compost metagenome]
MQMAAAAKLAALRIGGELPEADRQLLHSQFQKIQLAEAGSIRHEPPAADIDQFDMTGRMAPAAQTHADFACLQLKAGHKPVQQR